MHGKIYRPKVKLAYQIVSFVYLIVFLFSIGSTMFRDITLIGNIKDFLYWSVFLYILPCTILLIFIQSQSIVLTESHFRMKILGVVRYELKYKDISCFQTGKMNGQPIINIQTNNPKRPTLPAPYIPFERDWEDILSYIKKRAKHVRIDLDY